MRWMIRRDMPEVVAIAATANKPTWVEEDFLRALRQGYDRPFSAAITSTSA